MVRAACSDVGRDAQQRLSDMKLVIGASGFVGSHVVRQLVERGEDVRVLLRATSSTHAIDDLDVERRYGDFVDDDSLPQRPV
jgi:dihydroflavonol-4-reductase